MNRMKQNIARDAESYMKNHRKKGRWYKLVTGLACIVVFCTTYALILPAITLEGNQCGIEEHTHTGECYTQVTSITRKVPVCTVEGLDIHEHSEKCYDDQKNLICGYADFVAHKHDETCYREDGTLWCPLEEREPHVHDESCYTLPEPHVHTDECYTLERGELICTEHVHTDECYTETTGLTCGLEESEGHHHDESCHDAEGNLVCGQEESEGHHHSESCYGPVRTLTCGHEGDHQHTDACYEQEKVLTCELSTDPVTEQVLVCGKEEILLHTHTEECYDKHGNLTCGHVEIKEHKHTDACFREEQEPVDTEALTCTLPEDENHTHTARCYGTWELTCGKEEHTHTLACYADPEADLETEADWEKTFASVTLTGKWREDLTALAETQLGYAESEHNYIVLEDGETTKGYTRYGAWQDDPYMDWDAAFVSFCLHYAGVTEIPVSADCAGWPGALGEQYAPADAREPVPGDLVFFDRDSDGSADHVGILLEVTEGTEGTPAVLTTIEGDAENAVAKCTHSAEEVLGYGILPEQAKTFTLTATTESGITVTVTGDSASLPCLAGDVTVVVKELDEKERQEIEAQLSEDEERKESEVRYLLDISLRRGENEIEPVGPVNVTFSGLDMEGPYSKVYHIDTEENVVTDMAAVKDEDGNISMATNHFSIYMLADEVTPEGTEIRTTGTLLSAISNSSGGKFYLGEDVSWSSQITISGNVTLDLNGQSIKFDGTGSFLVVSSGATLTILDSKAGDDRVTSTFSTGNLCGHTASLTLNNGKPTGLTYYVTTSAPLKGDPTRTEETCEVHTVTPGGCIYGTNSGTESIVRVENGGTLNLNEGMLSINCSDSNPIGNAAHIICNHGTLNMNGGFVCGANGNTTGAGISSNGTFNMNGGVVAANSGNSGGGIYIGQNGSFTMNGGTISGNKASRWAADRGGGVCADWNTTVTIHGGYITNNEKGVYDDGHQGNGCHGGGGISMNSGTFTMSGGYITGNYSAEAGGGVYIGVVEQGSVTFTMSGGFVAGNCADKSEGGGIRVSGAENNPSAASKAIISASQSNKAYITNNKTTSTFDWGGGGFFVQKGGTLQVFNSLITANSAGGYGGGVGACPTGTTVLAANNGAAIYSNSASGTNLSGGGYGKNDDSMAHDKSVFTSQGYADYFIVKKDNNSVITTVSGKMLGGGASNWKGSIDDKVISSFGADEERSANWLLGLTADPTDIAKNKAKEVAGVIISGNNAHNHGGGIMTNGGLVIGSKNEQVTPLPSLEITGTKVLKINGNPQNSGRDFTFQLLDSTRKRVVGTATADPATGEFSISPKESFGRTGTYTYYLREVNDGQNGVTYDSAEYRIDITIASRTSQVLNTTYTTYYVQSVTVNGQTSGGGTSSDTFKIHVFLPVGWNPSNLRLYIWNSSRIPELGWPGYGPPTEDTNNAGWYTFEFNVSNSGSFNYIVNNNGDSQTQSQERTEVPCSKGGEMWITYCGGKKLPSEEKPASWYDGGGDTPIIGAGFTHSSNPDGSYTIALQGDTFTNTKTASMNLKLIKTDSNDATKLLSGATFCLKKSDGTYDKTITTSGTGADTGVALFEGLERNTTYYLWETKAPANYYEAGPWILETGNNNATLYPAKEEGGKLVKVNENDPGTLLGGSGTDPILLTATIEDNPWGYELPHTGGTGTQMYTLGGLLLIAAAGLLAYSRRKRRKEDFASF